MAKAAPKKGASRWLEAATLSAPSQQSLVPSHGAGGCEMERGTLRNGMGSLPFQYCFRFEAGSRRTTVFCAEPPGFRPRRAVSPTMILNGGLGWLGQD